MNDAAAHQEEQIDWFTAELEWHRSGHRNYRNLLLQQVDYCRVDCPNDNAEIEKERDELKEWQKRVVELWNADPLVAMALFPFAAEDVQRHLEYADRWLVDGKRAVAQVEAVKDAIAYGGHDPDEIRSGVVYVPLDDIERAVYGKGGAQ